MRPLTPEQFRALSMMVPVAEDLVLPDGFDVDGHNECVRDGLASFSIQDEFEVWEPTDAGELAYRAHVAWLATGGGP